MPLTAGLPGRTGASKRSRLNRYGFGHWKKTETAVITREAIGALDTLSADGWTLIAQQLSDDLEYQRYIFRRNVG